MVRSRSVRRGLALVAVAMVVMAGCSSDSESDGTTDTTKPAAMTEMEARVATVVSPRAEGKGINAPQPAAKLPDGYVEEELFIEGTATRFDPVDTPDDGFWTVTPVDDANYKTRVIVRRPADPAAFSGTVLVEWFNVSAIEASPDWGYLAPEIGREGHAYVGVSLQRQGVEGGDTVLDVEVDEQTAASAQTDVNTDKSGLRHIDPERYGTLIHPGDAYSYDMFGQIGRAIEQTPEALLGDLVPTKVIGVGESQSATFLTTYLNAVRGLAPVYDGFLVHSRLGIAAPLQGEYFSARREMDDPEEEFRQGVLIRTDIDVPVMIFETETDLTVLGYAYARQPDTDLLRTWEVAGTAHADAHLIRAVLGGPRDPGVGSLLGCGSINTGPQFEVLTAAAHSLVDWVSGGPPPATGQPIETSEGADGAIVIVRDDDGNALGGVRNPLVDAPVAALSGDPIGGGTLADLEDGGDLCVLFGSTTPFDQATLVELYGTADSYVEQFEASAAEQVAGGFLLQPEADALNAEAEANRSLFPG